MQEPNKTPKILLWLAVIHSAVVEASSGDNQYVVNYRRGTCTCPDHVERHHACKHLRQVLYELSLKNASPGEDDVPF